MKTRKINKDTISIFLGTSIVIGITILSSVALSSSNVFADNDNVVDEINITVPVSCTFSGTGQNSHNAEINNGVYTDNIGTTTMKALCNDNEGFSIYATGFTGNEIGGENSNKLVGTTASGNATIITGTATGPVGTTDTSNWAMKLTPTTAPTPTYPITIDSDTEGAFTGYHTVPNTYATDISGVQAPGTYVGQVKYTLVHPATEEPLQPQPAAPGKIVYHKNDSKAIGTMADQSANNNAIVTLYPSNFSKQGYGFAGWSDKYDYATNPEANFYGPNEDITTPSDLSTKGLSLYAIWIKSEGSIQDTAKVSQVCNRLTQSGPSITKTLNSVSALTDQRDGNTYAIAKLADGKCWMIENLRLDNTAEHNSDGTLAQGYGTSATYGNFGGLADPESANFENSTTANSLYYSGTQSGDATINIGTSNLPGYRMSRYNNLNTSARGTNTTTSQNIYSYGNYYTWHAAIADLTYNGTNNQSTTGTSLCPTGWRLPKGGDKSNEANNEFWSLITTGLNNGTKPANYDSSTYPYYTGTPEGSDVSKLTRNFPNNFLYSGYFNTSSAFNRGSRGYYWSSTAYDSYYSYYLYLYSSNVYPGTYNDYKNYGRSIRCVAGS